MGANVQCAWGVVSNELTTGASERSLGSGDAEVGRHQIGGRGGQEGHVCASELVYGQWRSWAPVLEEECNIPTPVLVNTLSPPRETPSPFLRPAPPPLPGSVGLTSVPSCRLLPLPCHPLSPVTAAPVGDSHPRASQGAQSALPPAALPVTRS